MLISCALNRGVPIIAVLGLGYGFTVMRDAQIRVQQQSMQEEERLRQNARLMDAYGDKSSLEDMQRALEHYHKVSTSALSDRIGKGAFKTAANYGPFSFPFRIERRASPIWFFCFIIIWG